MLHVTHLLIYFRVCVEMGFCCFSYLKVYVGTYYMSSTSLLEILDYFKPKNGFLLFLLYECVSRLSYSSITHQYSIRAKACTVGNSSLIKMKTDFFNIFAITQPWHLTLVLHFALIFFSQSWLQFSGKRATEGKKGASVSSLDNETIHQFFWLLEGKIRERITQ